MYSSEVFPLVYREVGMSLACAVNFASAGALALAVSVFSDSLEHNNHFKLLAGLDAVASLMVWLWMRSPEEAVSLEDMNV